ATGCSSGSGGSPTNRSAGIATSSAAITAIIRSKPCPCRMLGPSPLLAAASRLLLSAPPLLANLRARVESRGGTRPLYLPARIRLCIHHSQPLVLFSPWLALILASSCGGDVFQPNQQQQQPFTLSPAQQQALAAQLQQIQQRADALDR